MALIETIAAETGLDPTEVKEILERHQAAMQIVKTIPVPERYLLLLHVVAPSEAVVEAQKLAA